MDCGFESNTYDPFLDISLEINRAATVEKALARFTAGEALDGNNKYKCPRQKRFVRAVKRITIEVCSPCHVLAAHGSCMRTTAFKRCSALQRSLVGCIRVSCINVCKLVF